MRAKYLLFIFVIVVLSACQNSSTTDDRKVFRFNMSSGLSSLDPAFSKDQATMWMCNQIFNGLVQLDDSLNVLPSIAQEYFISDDGLTYTFTLRDDVYFHEHTLFGQKKTRRVVAEDFVYSFQRIIDQKVASPGAWLFNGKVRDENPFVAINDSVFELHLKMPFRPMLGLLTLQYCSVVPKEVVEYYGKDFRTIAIGTGPFKMRKWQEGEALVLIKNPKYFESDSSGNSLPYLDGIRISFLTDRGIEFLQFLQGGFDMVNGLDKSFIDKAVDAHGNLKANLSKDVSMLRAPYMNTEYLGFSMNNVKNKALENVQVRKAISYAIDREKMLVYLKNGIGVPAHHGIIPQGVRGFSPKIKGYSYDLQKAKQLLVDAGYANGSGIDKIILSSNPMYQDLTEFIAKSLEDIGLVVEVQLYPGSFLREAMAKNEVDFFRASWIGDYPDAENFLALFYGKNTAPPNYTHFKNEKYDELYLKAMSAKKSEVAEEIYVEMEQLMLNESPIVPLFYDELIRFTGNRVQYLSSNPMNLLVLKNAMITSE